MPASNANDKKLTPMSHPPVDGNPGSQYPSRKEPEAVGREIEQFDEEGAQYAADLPVVGSADDLETAIP